MPLCDLQHLLEAPSNCISPLVGDETYDAGDFRSEECVELLKQSDVVITNPPFSLFREFVAQIVEHEKKFLMIGSMSAVTYKEVFPLIRDQKMWLGVSIHSGDREFRVPDHYPLNAAGSRVDEQGRKYIRVKGVRWFTNMDNLQRHEKLSLYKKYTPAEYPKYDNYAAIEVSKVAEIPVDYFGTMGVPITFFDKYNPTQFEILAVTQSWCDGRIKTYPRQIQVGVDGVKSAVTKLNDGAALKLDSPPNDTTYYIVGPAYYAKVYARILIRRRDKL